jgi:hypothetical protein
MNDEELMLRVAQAMRDDLRVEHSTSLSERAAPPVDPAADAQITRAVLALQAASRPLPRARRWAARSWAVTGFAAVAIVLLSVRGRDTGDALPAYSTTFRGGEQRVRGEGQPARSASLGMHSRLEWVLRPEEPVHTEIAAKVYYKQAHKILPLTAAIEVSHEGVIRITGRLDEAQLSPGPVALIAVIAAHHELPSSSEQVASVLSTPPASWRVLTEILEIRP